MIFVLIIVDSLLIEFLIVRVMIFFLKDILSIILLCLFIVLGFWNVEVEIMFVFDKFSEGLEEF